MLLFDGPIKKKNLPALILIVKSLIETSASSPLDLYYIWLFHPSFLSLELHESILMIGLWCVDSNLTLEGFTFFRLTLAILFVLCSVANMQKEELEKEIIVCSPGSPTGPSERQKGCFDLVLVCMFSAGSNQELFHFL